MSYEHLLGRAPYDESEITEHVNLYVEKGYEAEINSYLDSLEDQENVGDSIVPFFWGFETQRHQKTVGFTRIFQLYQGYANSDRAQGKNKAAWLTQDLARNTSQPYADASLWSKPIWCNGWRSRQLYKCVLPNQLALRCLEFAAA